MQPRNTQQIDRRITAETAGGRTEIFMAESEFRDQNEEIRPEEKKEPETVPAKKAKKPEKTLLSGIFDTVEAIVFAAVLAIVILTIFVRTGFVEGSSMVPTMHQGDRYLISNLFYTPKQGDIVVFSPDVANNPGSKLWVKRIIATEGQKVYINPDDGKVYIDDVLYEEPYLTQPTEPKVTDNPIVVPEGYVFVMGDNRGDSMDSRNIGCVDTRRIVGRLLVRIFPLNQFGFVN